MGGLQRRVKIAAISQPSLAGAIAAYLDPGNQISGVFRGVLQDYSKSMFAHPDLVPDVAPLLCVQIERNMPSDVDNDVQGKPWRKSLVSAYCKQRPKQTRTALSHLLVSLGVTVTSLEETYHCLCQLLFHQTLSYPFPGCRPFSALSLQVYHHRSFPFSRCFQLRLLGEPGEVLSILERDLLFSLLRCN